MLCPHSAVGVSALHQLNIATYSSVALATAHEAKFPAACKMAVPELPTPPVQLSRLKTMKTRSQTCKNDIEAVQNFMKKRIHERKSKGDKRKVRTAETCTRYCNKNKLTLRRNTRTLHRRI